MRRAIISLVLTALFIIGVSLCPTIVPAAGSPVKWSSSPAQSYRPLPLLTALPSGIKLPALKTTQQPDSVTGLGIALANFSGWVKAEQANQQAQAAAAQQAAESLVQEETTTTTQPPVQSPTDSATASSGGWAAVATCEEGGNDDPNYGYYGIKEWNGFDGYATAGDAPQSVQLEWEQQNVGSPPDESNGCVAY